MLTDSDLLCERPHRNILGGVQRIYRFPGGMGLSCVNAPILHHYPFAWEIAVIRGVEDNGDFEELDYETGLTDDVEVFSTDAEANEFIDRARTALSRAPDGEG